MGRRISACTKQPRGSGGEAAGGHLCHGPQQFHSLAVRPYPVSQPPWIDRTDQPNASELRLTQGCTASSREVALRVEADCRYIAENVNSLPLGVVTRMCRTNDSLMAIIAVLEKRPWSRSNGSKEEEFRRGMWQPANGNKGVCQYEAQASLLSWQHKVACRKDANGSSHSRETGVSNLAWLLGTRTDSRGPTPNRFKVACRCGYCCTTCWCSPSAA